MFKNKAYMKMLISTTLGALIILSSMFMINQNRKIDKLEEELYLKQQNEQRASDHYESLLNIKTIENKFNALHEYPVLKDCTIDMDHTYNYTAEGRMGIKKHVEMSGHGKLQYSVVVNLSSAIITSNNNGKDITIQIEAPYVDQPSIKLMQNSLVIQNTDYSFFANRSDGAQAQKLYMDSFVDSGIKKISDLYSTKDKQNYIDRVAKSEIHSLVRALNLNGNVNIRVEIIK
jgi:hypothetical protein